MLLCCCSAVPQLFCTDIQQWRAQRLQQKKAAWSARSKFALPASMHACLPDWLPRLWLAKLHV